MNQRLRVAFICPTVASYIGGTETVVSQICNRLKQAVQLTLLSGDPGAHAGKDLINTDGMELVLLPFAGRDSRLNRFLSRMLMTSPFKIESFSFFRSLAKSGLDLSHYDYVVTFYEADAYLLSKRYPSLLSRCRHFLPGVSLRGFFRKVPATGVFFFGYRAAEKVKRKWGVDIPSLPLGVDAGFFTPHPPAYPDAKRLLYVGRLDGSKHVDWLADFFVQSGLAQRGYHLDIVGDGPLMDGLQKKYGAFDSVTLHGRMRQEAVTGILQKAFLLLHPTDHESFGLTILEAMAAGVPVITHDLDSIKAWAKDCPRYAAYLDMAAWRDEISRFEDRAYWQNVSAAGFEHAKAFTWDRVSEQVLALMTAQRSADR